MTDPGMIHYFAVICTPAYNKAHAVNGLVGAAKNKVVGVCRAVVRAGGKVEVVSSPVLGPMGARLLPGVLLPEGAVAIRFLPVFTIKGLNRLFAMLAFLWHTSRYVKAQDTVILYGPQPDYALAALYLWARRRPAIFDVEDAPHDKADTLRERVNGMFHRYYMVICRPRKLAASTFLSERYSRGKGCVVYGVQPLMAGVTTLSVPVRIMFGGSLMRETGVDLFCAALELIAVSPRAGQLEFVVTGFGDTSCLHKVVERLRGVVNVELFFDVGPERYTELLRSCSVGLSLKLRDSVIGYGTFPSKVLEFAGSGLLLISTPVSDVPSLFPPGTAVILREETPECLAEALLDIPRRLAHYQLVADAGRQVVQERCSELAVGKQVLDFIYGVDGEAA